MQPKLFCSGIACVEVCRRLVELTGRPINELFDYICGVSTGAILGFAFGVKKKQIDEVSQLYRYEISIH